MTQVKMTVNGKTASGEVEGRTLLAQFLRDDQGLTGTHVGCDTSQCGACAVHVNGKAVKSCTMLAIEADGAEVATIEGQANADGSLNVIQQAFQDHHGLQCGFARPAW
jgi:carbon-monoxide dehydrogenase small subunit